MSSKVDRLINKVVDIVNNTTSENVQAAVGDSVNNNRIVSVNQTIRYLRQTATNWTLGADLNRAYQALRRQGAFKRLRRNKNRTDAIDMNELLDVVDRLNTTKKREVGQRIFYV